MTLAKADTELYKLYRIDWTPSISKANKLSFPNATSATLIVPES